MAGARAQRRGTRSTKLKSESTGALPRAVTPSRDRELLEDPGTPGMEPSAPQPRRPLRILASSTTGSPDSADRAANGELRALLGGGDGPLGDLCERPAWYLKASGPDGEMGADCRPPSSASTSAPPSSGPTPRPTTPRAYAAQSPFCAGSSQSEAGARRTQRLGGGGDRREPPPRSRKVFVGGVPQEMDKDALHRFFDEHAPVNNAWLQRCRAGSAANPSNSHRGFGFVIFMEAKAVDDLLGPNESRFFYPPGGGRLEVKRAVSSGDLRAEERTGKAERPRQSTPSADSGRVAGSDARAAPEAVRAAPWPTYQTGPAPQAITMTSAPWHGCDGRPLVQQAPAYAQGAQFQGMAAAAPNTTVSFRSDTQQTQCYGHPSTPRGGVGPTLASAPNMQRSGPRVGGDGVPHQMWLTGAPPQAAMRHAVQQVPQPLPQSAQQMGQRVSYWPQSVPVASGVASTWVPQGHAGMLMQQPHMSVRLPLQTTMDTYTAYNCSSAYNSVHVDAYSVCDEAVMTPAPRNYLTPTTAQATEAQLRAAMPDHYED